MRPSAVIFALLAFASLQSNAIEWPKSDDLGHVNRSEEELLWKRFSGGTESSPASESSKAAVSAAEAIRNRKGSFQWGNKERPSEVRYIDGSTVIVKLAFERSLGAGRRFYWQMHVLRKVDQQWEHIAFYESATPLTVSD